ncbi:MAG: TonB family protein [Sphingomicrobium sp.]
MPAYANQRSIVRPRERVTAFAAVALVQGALAFILLSGFRVDVSRSAEAVQRLIEITLVKPSPPPQPPPPPVLERPRKTERKQAAAPKSKPDELGGSPGPRPAHAPPSVAPVIAVKPTLAPSGGGTGQGPAAGAGAGGGAGGYGYGGGGGGTELVQIAGEITPRDYPRRLREAGIGGIVGLSFRVEPTGFVSRCTVTQSSGVPELDALTCRLIVQRFRYRPSTDRYGRPIADTVDGEHEWIPHR